MNQTTSRSARAGHGTDRSIPPDLESERAKLVYLAVRTYAPIDVDELKELLGMSGLALFPILGTLSQRDHVRRRGETVTFV